jgi:hypothetical protein
MEVGAQPETRAGGVSVGQHLMAGAISAARLKPDPLGVRRSLDDRLAVILDPERRVLSMTDRYRRATLLGNGAVVGECLLDLFPDNPDDPCADGVSNLGASLQHAASGEPHRMPLQRYDVRDRLETQGTWVEKFWLPTNVPVFGSGSREVVLIVHDVEDVTQAVRLHMWIDEQQRLLHEQQITLQQMQAELQVRSQRLREGQVRLRARLEGSATVGTIEEMQRALRAPSAPVDYLSSTDTAPATGIYQAYHHRHCSFGVRREFVPEGRPLPRCVGCREWVQYRLLVAWPH